MTRGWNSMMSVSKQTLGETHWRRKIFLNNYPTHQKLIELEAIMTTDASETH